MLYGNTKWGNCGGDVASIGQFAKPGGNGGFDEGFQKNKGKRKEKRRQNHQRPEEESRTKKKKVQEGKEKGHQGRQGH